MKIIKNTFAKVLGKIYLEGGIILRLRGLITILLIAISTLAFSQKINTVKQGYYQIKDTVNGEIVFIDNKDSEVEAIQGLINYQLNTGRKGFMIPPSYRVDISNLEIAKKVEIDTITVSRMAKEIGGWIDYTNAGIEPSPPKAWIPFTGLGVICYSPDTIHRWQKEYRFLRTKTFGKVSYEELTMPFQFRDSVNHVPDQNQYRIQTFGTQKHCIKYFVDNVWREDFESCNPGQISNIEWRHTRIITDLQPNTEYLIRVEGTTESGGFNIKEFKIKTLQ